MSGDNFNQGDEWQVQVSKRKRNNQRKQKKNQKNYSKEQYVGKNKRDNSYYYQTTKKTKEQNGNKNKNGKRSSKFESKMKKQNRGRDIIFDSISIERNKNLNVVKSTSLLKMQFERQQKECSLDLNSKELIVPNKANSEMSDVTVVSVASLASDSNSITSSTLTQTNSLKDQIDDNHNTEIVNRKDASKVKLSETTLLNKESDEQGKEESSNINSLTGSEGQKKEGTEISEQNNEVIRRLESQCSLSSSSSVTSFDSEEASKSEINADDNESVLTAKNESDDVKSKHINGNKNDENDVKENKLNNKNDMTKKVLEFNFKNYTDVKPFVPKHLKAQQEQSKVEVIAPKPQVAKQNKNTKNNAEKKHHENENISGRKTKEFNKIIRIDPSCLHQKDGHIVPISSYVMNMKNGKNSSNIQEIFQRNVHQKAAELQDSKKKYEELRKYLDNNKDNSKGYQSLPIRENESSNVAKKSEDKVVEKLQVRKTMSNPTLEVSSALKNKKEHHRTFSYTMIHNNMAQKTIPNLVEYRDDFVYHSICQPEVSNRIENEYNNVKCYNDPMEQSLTRVKPASIKLSRSMQNITTTLSRKGSNHQLLLGSGGCMTITNTVTTCKSTPKLRTSKSFSWLKNVRTELENTHVTTLNTTTTTSHTNTLYTNLVGSTTYPIVALPTSCVQELSVETTSRKLRNSTSLPNMMGKLLKKIAWPFGSNTLETEATPLTAK